MKLLLLFNKKAVSILVGYVLLILLTVSLAGLIYGFLQYRARLPEKLSCPEDVSVYVVNYSCEDGIITFWIKNSGLWNITGVNYKFYSGISPCIMNETIISLEPGLETMIQSNIGNCQINKLNKLEILPYIILKEIGTGPAKKDKKIFCSNAKISIDVDCL